MGDDDDEHHASFVAAPAVLAPPIHSLLPLHNAHDSCHAPADYTLSPGNHTAPVKPVNPDTDTDSDPGTPPICLPPPSSSLDLSLTNTPTPTFTVATVAAGHVNAKQQVVPPFDAAAVVDAPPTREWHSFARPDASATPEGNINNNNTGLGAGYFSPPQSPKEALQRQALPPTHDDNAARTQAQSTGERKTRLRSRSLAVADLVRAKARALPDMVKERRSLQSILVPSFLQALQSSPPSATASTSPVHARASPPAPGPSSTGSVVRSSIARKRAQTYANGSGPSTPLNSPTSASFDHEFVNAAPSLDALAMATASADFNGPGRVSPSSYLLDDDPFAPAMPITPMYPMSPPVLSPSASVISLVDASEASMSMPGTPGPGLPDVPEYQELEVPAVSPLRSRPTLAPITTRTQSASSVLSIAAPEPATVSALSPPPSPLSPRSPLHAGPSASTTALHVHSRVRPAHTRPAFTPRPSLPSLSTLARMGAGWGSSRGSLGAETQPSSEASSPTSGTFTGFPSFGIRLKKRKGKVGAGLPVEPWDMPESMSIPLRRSDEDKNGERGRPVEKGTGTGRARARTIGNGELALALPQFTDVRAHTVLDGKIPTGARGAFANNDDDGSDLEWAVAPVSSLQPSPASSMHNLTEQGDGGSRRGSFAAEAISATESNVDTDADKALVAIGQVMQMDDGFIHDASVHDDHTETETGSNHASISFIDLTADANDADASANDDDDDDYDRRIPGSGGCATTRTRTQDQTLAQIRHDDSATTSRRDGGNGNGGDDDGTISSERQQRDRKSNGGILHLVVTPDADFSTFNRNNNSGSSEFTRLVSNVDVDEGEGADEVSNVERADTAGTAAAPIANNSNASGGLFTSIRLSGEENTIGVDHRGTADAGRLSFGNTVPAPAPESTTLWTGAVHEDDILDRESGQEAEQLQGQEQHEHQRLRLHLNGASSVDTRSQRDPAQESSSSFVVPTAAAAAAAAAATSVCVSGQEFDKEPCSDRGEENLHSLILDSVARPSLPAASEPIAITAVRARPRRASAIPRHIRRTILSSPPSGNLNASQHGIHGIYSTPLEAEKEGGEAEEEEEDGRAPSPQSSIEDFGIVLNVSPGHFAYAAANAHRDSVRLRPESFALDPDLAGLPARSTTTTATSIPQRTRSPLAALEEKPLPELPPPSSSSTTSSTFSETPASEEVSSSSPSLLFSSSTLLLSSSASESASEIVSVPRSASLSSSRADSSSISFESEQCGNDQIKVGTEADIDTNTNIVPVPSRVPVPLGEYSTLATDINDDSSGVGDGINSISDGTHEQGDRVFSSRTSSEDSNTEVVGAGTPANNAPYNYATSSSSSSSSSPKLRELSRLITSPSIGVGVSGKELSVPVLGRLEAGSSVARLSLVAEAEAGFEPESFVELAFDDFGRESEDVDVPVFERQYQLQQQQQYQLHYSEEDGPETRNSAGQEQTETETDSYYYTTSPSEYFGEEEDDSSMLPPLSTLPEEDPVFSLSPSRSRSHSRVGGVGAYSPSWSDYPPTPARTPPLSRKPSNASSSHHSYSKGQGLHALNAANSGHGQGLGLPARPMPRARHVAGSASADFGAAGASAGSAGTTPSLRSQSSFDSRFALAQHPRDSNPNNPNNNDGYTTRVVTGHARFGSQGSHGSTASLRTPSSMVSLNAHARAQSKNHGHGLTRLSPSGGDKEEFGFGRSTSPSVEELTMELNELRADMRRLKESGGRGRRMVDEDELRGLGIGRRRDSGGDDEDVTARMLPPRDLASMDGDAVYRENGWRPFTAQTAAGFDPGSSAGTIRPRLRNYSGSSEGGFVDHAGAGSGGSGRQWESEGKENGYRSYGYGHGGASNGNGSSGSDYSDERGGGPMRGGRRGRDDSRDDRDRGRESGRARGPSVSSSTSTSSESDSSESVTDDYGHESPSLNPNSNVNPTTTTATTHTRPPHAIPVAFPSHDDGHGYEYEREGDRGRGRRSATSSLAASTAGTSGNTTGAAPLRANEDSGMLKPIFNQLRNGRKGVFKPPQQQQQQQVPVVPSGREPEDDDVPLARSIPGALKAQKSIRQKVRDERERRRRDKSQAPGSAQSHGFGRESEEVPVQGERVSRERGRTMTMRAAPMSSSQEAALAAQQRAATTMLQQQQQPGMPPARRARAKTISSADAGGVAPDDLTRRLLKVQARVEPSIGHSQQSSVSRTSGELLSAMSPPRAHQVPHSAQPQTQVFSLQDPPPQARTIRPMRSFHGAAPASASAAAATAPPVPVPSGGLGRRQTLSRPRNSQEARSPMRMSFEEGNQPPVPSLPASAVLPSHPISPTRAGFAHGLTAAPAAPIQPGSVVQTRVYIGDMQRFNVVEACPETNARDVLEMLGRQGDLRGEVRLSSSWVLYEVCHDYGMERPIRSFELITDISGSWPKDKTLNCFMAKRSPFASFVTSIPSSIPTRSGPVDYQSKKGKWSRRWLELREHGLWLSKKEGKDDEFLCSLSAFDVYVVTRIQKTPKSFCFAVKSTDPITLFENKSDYVHIFSCHDEVGMKWVESILLARSYILYQEKHVLFRNKESASGSGTVSNGGGASLSRAGTKKRPEKAFVNLNGPSATPAGPFEPGSLLAKRAAVA